MTEYRLSWEVLDPHICAQLADNYGKAYWTLPNVREVYQAVDNWHRSEVVFHEDSTRMKQYETLKSWEENGIQPVRRVRLEKRNAPDVDQGWTSV